ncbi:protein phosphatase 2C domain-containing protein [Desulfobacterales bacterium HSG17]|nr:protein phosphatase 2C domain-containing protein [Desulfobacterales bacterium HSG17]
MTPSKAIQDESYTHELHLFRSEILLAVCDGMGGHESGEKASWCVSKELPKKIFMEDANKVKIQKSISNIQEEARTSLPENSGTTLAGIWIKEGTAYVFNAGDSRIFSLEKGKIHQISRDHSLVQTLLDEKKISPEEAFDHPYKNVVNFGMGPAFREVWPRYQPHVEKLDISAPIAFLLCSDGITDIIRSAEIAEILGRSPVENGERLMEKAKAAGLKDNTSYVIVEVQP